MRRMVSSQGLGKGYDRYDSSDALLSVNQISRYQMPFRVTHKGWSTTMLSGGQNRAQSNSLAVQSAATKSAAVETEAISKNFRST